jgi:pyrroloquinoline quinone biosynthesis protein B
MRIRVLGTAAGGGLPQWNCGCDGCQRARTEGRDRLQDCLAISGDGGSWYLVNASPDLRAQLLAHPELAPSPGARASPLRGVLLTSAELDHTLGLLMLRESERLTVHATASVWEALPLRTILSSYSRLDWVPVSPDDSVTLDGGIVATAFAPGTKPPRYVAEPGPAMTVAYRFDDPGTGGALVYAPGLADWSEAFERGLAGADVVLLDGTFSTAAELRPGAARSMGHLSIQDSLPRLIANPGPRYLYTHLNNTNPYAHMDGDQISEGQDIRVARDGELIVV